MVYDRRLKLYKGVSNPLTFTFKNEDQKAQDITSKTFEFNLIDSETKQSVVTRNLSILDDGSPLSTKGTASGVAGTGGTSSSAGGNTEVYAWRMFQNVFKILQQFGALNGTQATELGRMVGSLSGDNELWLAMVLRSDFLRNLTEGVRPY
jgi:hypothetical protein